MEHDEACLSKELDRILAALATTPDDLRLRYEAADRLHQLGRDDAACPHLEAILDARPLAATPALCLATVYHRQGRFAEALARLAPFEEPGADWDWSHPPVDAAKQIEVRACLAVLIFALRDGCRTGGR